MCINSTSDSIEFYKNYQKVRNNEIESFEFAGYKVELDIPKTTGLKKLMSKAFSKHEKTAKLIDMDGKPVKELEFKDRKDLFSQLTKLKTEAPIGNNKIAIVKIKNFLGYGSITKFEKLRLNNPSQVATERSITFRASNQSDPIEFKLPKEAFGKKLNIEQQGKIYDNAIDALALCDRIKESGSKNISRSDLNKLCSYYDKLKGNLEDGSPVLKEIFSTFDSIIDQSFQKGNQLNQTNDLYAAMEFATNSISASEATPSNMKELKSYIEGKITEICQDQIKFTSNFEDSEIRFECFCDLYNITKDILPKDSPEFKEISFKLTVERFRQLDDLYNKKEVYSDEDFYYIEENISPRAKEDKIKEDINQICKYATQGASDTAEKFEQLNDIYNAAKAALPENSYVLQEISSKIKGIINQICKYATQGASDTAGKLKKLGDIYNTAKSSLPSDSPIFQEISSNIKKDTNQILTKTLELYNEIQSRPGDNFLILPRLTSEILEIETGTELLCDNLNNNPNNATLEDIQSLSNAYQALTNSKLKDLTPDKINQQLQELKSKEKALSQLSLDKINQQLQEFEKAERPLTLEQDNQLNTLIQSRNDLGSLPIIQYKIKELKKLQILFLNSPQIKQETEQAIKQLSSALPKIQSTIKAAMPNVPEKIKQNTNNPSEQLNQINHFSHYAENTFGSLSSDFESLLPTIKEITLSACKNLSNNINHIELKDVQSLSYAYQTFKKKKLDFQNDLHAIDPKSANLEFNKIKQQLHQVEELNSASQEIQSTFEAAVSSIYDNEIKNNNPETLTENLTELWNIIQDTQLENSSKLEKILSDIDAKITPETTQESTQQSESEIDDSLLNQNFDIIHFDDIEKIDIHTDSDSQLQLDLLINEHLTDKQPLTPSENKEIQTLVPEVCDDIKKSAPNLFAQLARFKNLYNDLKSINVDNSVLSEISKTIETLTSTICDNIKKSTPNLINRFLQFEKFYNDLKSINVDDSVLSMVLSNIEPLITRTINITNDNINNLKDDLVISINYFCDAYNWLKSIKPGSPQLPQIADTIDKLTPKYCDNIKQSTSDLSQRLNQFLNFYDNLQALNASSSALPGILSKIEESTTEILKYVTENMDNLSDSTIKSLNYTENMNSLSDNSIAVLAGFYSRIQSIDPNSNQLPKIADTIEELTQKICENINKNTNTYEDQLDALKSLYDNVKLNDKDSPALKSILSDMQNTATERLNRYINSTDDPVKIDDLLGFQYFYEILAESSADQSVLNQIISTIKTITPQIYENVINNTPQHKLFSTLEKLKNTIKNLPLKNSPELQDTLLKIDSKIADLELENLNKQQNESPKMEQPSMPPPPSQLNTAMPQPPIINQIPLSSHTTIPTSVGLPQPPSTGLPPPPTIPKSVQEIKFQPIPNQSSSTGLPPPPTIPKSVRQQEPKTKQPIKYSSNGFPLPPEPLNTPLSSENNTPPLNTN